MIDLRAIETRGGMLRARSGGGLRWWYTLIPACQTRIMAECSPGHVLTLREAGVAIYPCWRPTRR